MSEKLLDVKNLHTSFFTHLGEVQAIRDVSFGLDKGEIIGIVGESGSGRVLHHFLLWDCLHILEE